MDKALYEACVVYLKSYDLKRFMGQVREKYCSFGMAKGNVLIEKPTLSEIEFLRGLFKKDFSGRREVKIGLSPFEKAFAGTQFHGIDLKTLLEAYFGEKITENKRLIEFQKDAKAKVLESVKIELSNPSIIKWIGEAFEDSSHLGYRLMAEWLSDRNAHDLKTLFLQFEKLLGLLSHHDEGLAFPIAAAKVTGYPHDLDKDMPLRKLLTVYARSQYPEDPFETLEDQEALFEKMNLSSNEIPRMVLTYGLDAFDSNGDTLNWEIFHRRFEPLLINGFNLKSVAFLKAKASPVRVFENPAAFYHYISENQKASAVCTHGQLHLLDWMLLDLIHQSGLLISYSGDFDPEGLWIAERLKKRYPSLDLSFFTGERYLQKKSQEVISEKRLKQLARIHTPELEDVAKLMQVYKVAGYEEG